MYARLHNASFEEVLAVFVQNYWKSHAIFSWKAANYMPNALRMSGLYLTSVFCIFVACFKDSTWHSFKHFFQVTTILSWEQLYVRYKPALRVRSAMFAFYCIKCKQSTPAERYGGYACCLSNGSIHLNAHHSV